MFYDNLWDIYPIEMMMMMMTKTTMMTNLLEKKISLIIPRDIYPIEMMMMMKQCIAYYHSNKKGLNKISMQLIYYIVRVSYPVSLE